jgi:hypothetical protein
MTVPERTLMYRSQSWIFVVALRLRRLWNWTNELSCADGVCVCVCVCHSDGERSRLCYATRADRTVGTMQVSSMCLELTVITIHLQLVPRLGMRGAMRPLPQYVFTVWCLFKRYVFMAWCLVKHRDNFTFNTHRTVALIIAHFTFKSPLYWLDVNPDN